MDLPFTREEFFALFTAYNTAVWPMQLVLLVLGIAISFAVLFHRDRAGHFVACGLAALWTWTSLAYHLCFFRGINPAAWGFAVLGLATAAAFLWFGAVRGRLTFAPLSPGRKFSGWSFVAFAIAGYPLLGAWAGHVFPAAPTFGLPCPITLFTIGLLLLSGPGARLLVLGPLAWTLIGASAAIALDVPQDYSLFVAFVAGAWLLWRRPQWEKSTGVSVAPTTSRVAPPSTSSRQWRCP